MKVSVIISACPNREELFERSLFTYARQNFSKKDFEIILVDDGDRQELFHLCERYHRAAKLQFQYVKIDPSKSSYPIKSFTPALTNNVGFRLAEGEVVVITGPETMQAEDNMKIAYTMANRMECAYGLVFRASQEFNNYLNQVPWRGKPFSEILKYPGAQAECRTKPPHPPAYWYCMAVARGYVMQIRGVDERFLEGICAEDDDFANRMRFSGVKPVFEHNIIGIHQNHDAGDAEDQTHNIRASNKWKELRQFNMNIMYENIKGGNPVANKDHTWGNLNTITERVVLK